MIQLHPKYIFDKISHKKSVIISFLEWENIINEMEELEDIRAYDATLLT